MDWLNWLKEIGIAMARPGERREIRTPIVRSGEPPVATTEVSDCLRALYERQLIGLGNAEEFVLEEQESVSGWVWKPQQRLPEEQFDHLLDEWALRIREMGYVEQLNEQLLQGVGAEQKIRYRRYLKPSLRRTHPDGSGRTTFGNVLFEIQKTQGITDHFRVQLTRYPGRDAVQTASMASLMERLLA